MVAGRALVGDGDSLQIDDTRIRLEGIDAPEFQQICTLSGRQSDCGRQAARHLRRLIGQRQVECAGWRVDRFERLLAVCHAGDIDLNARMVFDGWAVSFGAYEGEEAQARRAGRGLWAGSFDRPRDWRRDHMGEMAESAASGAVRHARAAGNRIDLAIRRLMAMVTPTRNVRGEAGNE